MTCNEAAAKYAEAYKAFQLTKEIPSYNLAVEVAYATMDVLNMVKTANEVEAVYVILDETACLVAATAKAIELRAVGAA